MWALGLDVDWDVVFTGTGAGVTDLPTYPFQRQRFWPRPAAFTGDVASVGLESAEHPLLGAVLELPEPGGVVLTGRLSVRTHPWLADHAVEGRVLVPGTALVELAVRAGDEAGTGTLSELVLEQPLLLPENGAVALRVVVGAEGEDDAGPGARPVAVYGRAEDAETWTRHASGVVTDATEDRSRTAGWAAVWPPKGAEAVDVTGFYAGAEATGYGYGPVFRGLRAVWRTDGEVFAEVGLEGEAAEQAGRFGLHPALLDSALHAVGAGELLPGGAGLRLPFTWEGVELFAAGASTLRVRLTALDSRAVCVEAVDATGAPVATVGSLVFRQVDADRLAAAEHGAVADSLYRVDWAPLTGVSTTAPDEEIQVLHVPGGPEQTGDGSPEGVRDAVVRVLGWLREWVAAERESDARLLVVTRGAVAVGSFGGDPVLGAVWGLLRSAQSDGGYWYDNLRNTVEFENATRAALTDGHTVLIEVSPHPVLSLGLQGTVEDTGTDAAVLGTLRRDEGGLDRFLTSLAKAHCHGLTVDWDTVFAGTGARRTPLPTYAFQHQHYWLEDEPEAASVRSGPSPVEAEFWKAVEAGDTEALARQLEGVGADALGAVLPALAAWRREATTRAQVDSWRYRISWKPLRAGARGGRLDGVWLVVAPECGGDGTTAAAAARALEGRGARVVSLALGEHQRDREGIAKALRAALEETDGTPLGGVLSLLAVADGAGGAAARDAENALGVGLPAVTAGTLALLQALDDSGTRAPLWCVTSGAVQIGRGGQAEPAGSPVQAQLWGMGQAIALEAPGSWGGLIDLPDTTGGEGGDASVMERMCAVLAGDLGNEDQVALRGSEVFARRVERAVLAGAGRRFEPRDTALVTGGTGSVGGRLARWLAGRGARHIVLTSRRGPDAPGAAELVADLARAGATATVVACDVADGEQVRALVERLEAEGRPVRSVFHTAGVDDTAAFQDTDADAYAAVLAGKVNGALHLDEVLGDSVDAFVLFSSISGVWGNARHSAYAAANASLDALAHRRRSRGRTATSVAWGWWEGGGLAGDEGVGGALSGLGLSAMAAEPALAAMAQAVEHGETAVVVADVDWSRFAPVFTAMRPSPLIGDLPEVRGLRSAEDAQDTGDAEGPALDAAGLLRAELVELSLPEREFTLLEIVRDHAAAVLGLDGPGEVRPDRAFRKLGFDSLTAVDLRNRIARATGLKLPAALVFDHPTPAVLARFLLGRLGLPPVADGDAGGAPAAPPATTPAPAPVPVSAGTATPVADDSIDDLDAESLIQLALGDNGS